MICFFTAENANALNILHNSQIGFLPKNRTADRVLTLRPLVDKYVHHHNEKIYACFVDFKKAFDSVWREGFLLKLLQINVGGCFFNQMKNLIIFGKIGQNQTRPFPYARSGARQGLSPLLFNLFINDIPFSFEKNFIPLSYQTTLYADDLVILSRSKIGLQNCFNTLSSYCSTWSVNPKKPKL